MQYKVIYDNFIMSSFVPGKNTPWSPNARLARRTGGQRKAFLSRYVGADHMPNYCSTKSCIECNRDTNVYCILCNTPLCITANGSGNCFINCFAHFHTPPDGTLRPNLAPYWKRLLAKSFSSSKTEVFIFIMKR